jgi:hypothetical protein
MRYGVDKYQYDLVDGWAKLAEGDSFFDIAGISIDSQDRLYIFNRSKRPMMVFDSEGNFLTSWGEEYFDRPHGSCIPMGAVSVRMVLFTVRTTETTPLPNLIATAMP